MRNIGSHGLQCPEFDDYAAVALYIQNLGTLIDSQLQAQLDLLQGFLDRPTIIVTNALARVVASSVAVSNLYDTVVFNNSSFMSLRIDVPASASYIDIGSPVGAPTTVPYLQGSYSMGCCAIMTAATPSAFSFRVVQMDVFDESVWNSPSVAFGADRTFETNTGGSEAQNVKLNFELTGISGVQAGVFYNNNNAAGNITYAAGALWWCTYNGPITAIEVA